jgi:hypothetical protein
MFVHRCRFVDYDPSGILSIAVSPLINNSMKTLVACSRENGSIEIWNPRDCWNLHKVPISTFYSIRKFLDSQIRLKNVYLGF